jgi:hypothetical protein
VAVWAAGLPCYTRRLVAAVHYFATTRDQESLADYRREPESITG